MAIRRIPFVFCYCGRDFECKTGSGFESSTGQARSTVLPLTKLLGVGYPCINRSQKECRDTEYICGLITV